MAWLDIALLMNSLTSFTVTIITIIINIIIIFKFSMLCIC